GMGDNIHLGDRDGVRTPMQWSPDRNGGFSRADPERLVLPALMGPLYGYEAINVEAQQRDPHSLLNWTRRTVATRRRHHAFVRGGCASLASGFRAWRAAVSVSRQPLDPRVSAAIRGQCQPVRGLPVARDPGSGARPRQPPGYCPGRNAWRHTLSHHRRTALSD